MMKHYFNPIALMFGIGLGILIALEVIHRREHERAHQAIVESIGFNTDAIYRLHPEQE